MIDCCPCYVVVVVSEANNPGDHKGAEPPYLAVYPRNARVIQLVYIKSTKYFDTKNIFETRFCD